MEMTKILKGNFIGSESLVGLWELFDFCSSELDFVFLAYPAEYCWLIGDDIVLAMIPFSN
jgi:hypothetical protein